MTKVLIVENDPAQSRLLKKALSRRRPEYSIVCSSNGREAIAILERDDVDIVLTDLQMPDGDGFELLAWLVNNKPAVPAFTMTAYGNPETQARVASLNSIECFTKPIDIAGVLRRFSDTMAQNIRGHVKNVGLPSFLQLLAMEQKTCTLTIRHDDKTGTLFMRKGELFDARLDGRAGEEAASAIIAWVDSTITIEAGCGDNERTIESPMGFLVMEAMRLQDENTRDFPATDTETTGRTVSATEAAMTAPEPPRPTPAAAASAVTTPPSQGAVPLNGAAHRGVVHAPAGASMVAVVDASTGVVFASDGKERTGIPHAAAALAAIFRKAEETVAACTNGEAIEEFVVATRSRYELIRPLPAHEGAFAMIVFDPTIINLMMARHELEYAIATYQATEG